MKNITYIILLSLLLSLISSKAQAQWNTKYGTGTTDHGTFNTSIGYYAGADEDGSDNVFLGYFAGRYSWDTDRNIFIGSQAGMNNDAACDNTYVGYRAGVLSETGGTNTFIGNRAGTYNEGGSGNVYLGSHAGYSSIGSGNVFLGKSAGYSETGSNKLYIANTSTTTPLIYGEFNNNLVGVNGKLGIGAKPITNAMLRVYKSGAPYIELADITNGFEIGLATAADEFATGSEAGDGVLKSTGGNHSMLLCIPNDENDGNSYIGFTDDYNGLWMKILNDRQVRIDGTVHAKEIKIETDVWSDHVFGPGYKLSSLQEVEAYIKENKHLPEVPCANEVFEHGIDVGKMNVILLQKVEELTLYLIDMEKRMATLEREKSCANE